MQRKHTARLTPLARELRQNLTKEERHLWYDFLRQYPVRFLRQKVVGNYIADFYCASAKIVVEIDGSQHYDEEAMAKDAERTSFLGRYGLTVLRFTNREIHENFRGVCEYIDCMVQKNMKLNGLGHPFDP